MTITEEKLKESFGPCFRQEQREREEFLRNTRTRTTVTEQIEAAIAAAGGSVRDALNVALAERGAAVALLRAKNEKVIALLEALETIRALCWSDDQSPGKHVLYAIDAIACKILKISGETP